MSFVKKLVRRKDAGGDVLATNLRRCLSTVDVAFFGIGNMLGSGIYILAPDVASKMTGPAIVLSFLLAGVASLLAALAYAEFGVRFPRSGSAYSYTYFALGEIIAFFVGWNLIMENVLSLAVVARTCSSYANSVSDGALANFTINAFGWLTHDKGSFLSSYPDVFSAILLISFLLFMMLGAKETSWLNNTLVVVNITVMAIILGVGGYHADFSNWKYIPERDEGHKPHGFINGFLPFGWAGVFAACAKCFFAYVGFDGIAAAGEEATNPRKSIPIATIITMVVVSSVYISVSGVLTLMRPYYDIDPDAGIPKLLKYVRADWAVYIVSAGAMASMITVIMGTIFAVSRVIYAMAEDGLLPSIFCYTFRKVPFISMIVCTVSAAFLAVFFDTDAIIEMLSIGTLFAYLIVAFGVVVVRHTPTVESATEGEAPRVTMRPWASFLQCLYPSGMKHKSLVIATLFIAACFAFAFGFSVNVNGIDFNLRMLLITVCGSVILGTVVYISPLKELLDNDSYKMPLVPLLPIISMSLNAFLMSTMDPVTWYRFIVWLALGTAVYFGHGFRNSRLNEPPLREEVGETGSNGTR